MHRRAAGSVQVTAGSHLDSPQGGHRAPPVVHPPDHVAPATAHLILRPGSPAARPRPQALLPCRLPWAQALSVRGLRLRRSVESRPLPAPTSVRRLHLQGTVPPSGWGTPTATPQLASLPWPSSLAARRWIGYSPATGRTTTVSVGSPCTAARTQLVSGGLVNSPRCLLKGPQLLPRHRWPPPAPGGSGF
ncbi:hypothetical protein NDU88_006829 [Pleurodeles waltl]|uniref:Uncharacterized protein n=1 Tax=Pleurodeles waltl TaxID=8319 RepID=A0AAV7UM56_PLEWA|nr:hypothetical protein NDU88_006829 [Pleurodeles waltl]